MLYNIVLYDPTIPLLGIYPKKTLTERGTCTPIFMEALFTIAIGHGEENGTHSNILAWKIPWTEEPGRLQSMGLQKVRHD